MSAYFSPVFNGQTFIPGGSAPASGYKLFTYVAGSSQKLTTYTDSTGTVSQSNPIILNAAGYPTLGSIWLPAGGTTKFVLALPGDTDPPTSPVKTIDGISGVNDPAVSASNQWQPSGLTPTYVSASTFTLPGDQTNNFHAGRRLQFITTVGTVYGGIRSSAFGALTTVTMDMDGTSVLDAGLTVVNIAIIRSDNSPIGFQQSGTGAIARIEQDKLRETISVFDFMTAAQIADVKSGAMALNHTAAVAAAITYANSLGTGNAQFATLEFPPGTYFITPGGLPSIRCDIYGPRASLVASSNALANLITIGVATGLSYNNIQKIRLYSLTGYAFTYSFSGTRYGYGLGFAATAGQFIPQLQVDIGFVQGFLQGIAADCSAGFHIGTNIFNIQTLWYCGTGIYSVSGNLEFENNIFNIVYVVGCNPTVYSGSTGTAHNVQNTYNIACLELHQIVGTTGFSLAGANTNQNIFNVASLSYNGNTTWIVNTDGLAWGNEYILPGVDVTKLTFANDILKSEGISPLNPSANNTRSIMYGASPAQNYPRRAGDRYIVNNPAAYGAASYVYSSGAWTVETFSGNVGATPWTPTITASSGTFTTVTATGSYSIMNGVCSFTMAITITTNGTAAGQVIATLPVAPTRVSAVCGRGDAVSGKQLQGKVFVGGNVNIANYDGTYPGANGELLIVSGQYYVN